MQKLNLNLLFLVIVLLLIQPGCLSSIGAGVVDQTSETGSILFADDFSNPPSGWGTWNRGGALVEYSDGGLRILVNDTHYDFWSVAGQNFSDVMIEVDATLVAGSVDNDYGIICRYQDKDNFYMLVISSDGYYGAAKLKNGQYSMIGSDQLQYSSAIVHGQSSNHLQADCIGKTLRLFANGQKLMEISDSDFEAGDVGLIAGSYTVKGVDVLFDNFVVREPGN